MKYLNVLAVLLISIIPAYSGPWVDAEGGAVKTGYNDVRIPSKGGTDISLSDDLNAPVEPYYRLRVGGDFYERHTVFVLYAPLKVDSEGKLKKDTRFQNKTFSKGSNMKAEYEFNSYRMTYRYTLFNTKNIVFGLGLTGKIRDAQIKLTGGGKQAERSNTGFVPLINLYLEWKTGDHLSLLFEGDGLAAPQGRAEDFFIGPLYHYNEKLSFRCGYRVLEGGSDGGGNVYTFSMFHYIAFGSTYNF